jgi:hypothetical protein
MRKQQRGNAIARATRGLDLRRNRSCLQFQLGSSKRRLGRRLGDPTTSASATHPPFRRASRTSRSQRVVQATAPEGTRTRFGAATARSSPGDLTPSASATCRIPAGLTLRPNRRGRHPQPRAAKRRRGHRLGKQRLGSVRRARSPGRAQLGRDRSRALLQCRSAERRLGRHLGEVQRPRPAQRALFVGWSGLRSDRGGPGACASAVE